MLARLQPLTGSATSFDIVLKRLLFGVSSLSFGRGFFIAHPYDGYDPLKWKELWQIKHCSIPGSQQPSQYLTNVIMNNGRMRLSRSESYQERLGY